MHIHIHAHMCVQQAWRTYGSIRKKTKKTQNLSIMGPSGSGIWSLEEQNQNFNISLQAFGAVFLDLAGSVTLITYVILQSAFINFPKSHESKSSTMKPRLPPTTCHEFWAPTTPGMDASFPCCLSQFCVLSQE